MSGRSKRGLAHSEDEGFHSAARAGDLKSLQKIYFSNPTAINARDNHSRTPLHLAAWSGQTTAVEFLCKNKADVGAAAVDDMSAIHFASQKGHLDVVRILLKSGASVNACTRKGMTALHYASQGGHIQLVNFLLHKGANINAKNKAGKLPIDVAKDDEVCLALNLYKNTSGDKKASHKRKETQDTPAVVNIDNTIEDKMISTKTDDNSKPTVLQEGENKEEQSSREDDLAESGHPPKKSRVVLSHLLEEENYES
eukprot:TRINITY_DN8960_c0_g1_i1.p1 TRINITY_DN8960_c0_g1~~TRINITY_DN8960_c0_g1_i1.p1  ORF type:complete len:254 (+),score=59.22 TRINITY_DN8960_c0_g1_i1:173-934(+)